MNLFSLTTAIWTFSPSNCRHSVYGEVPIQLHGPGHIYIYIYIYHLINIELPLKEINMFLIIKGNPNGYFTWAYVKKAYIYHKWLRRNEKLLIPFNMVNCFASVSCPNNIPLIHTITTNDNATLAICNCQSESTNFFNSSTFVSLG